MSVHIYDVGEHPAGFIGVVVRNGGKNNQISKYFTFRKKRNSSPPILISKAQQKKLIAKAHAINDAYKAKSGIIKGGRKVTRGFWNAKPLRDVGVVGITLTFTLSVSRHRSASALRKRPIRYDYAAPGFRVSKKYPERGQKVFYIKNGYNQAWANAVKMWAGIHGIDEAAYGRTLKNMPPPEQFKKLLKQMQKEGKILPSYAFENINQLCTEYRHLSKLG